jgi:hypothetical protein
VTRLYEILKSARSSACSSAPVSSKLSSLPETKLSLALKALAPPAKTHRLRPAPPVDSVNEFCRMILARTQGAKENGTNSRLCRTYLFSHRQGASPLRNETTSPFVFSLDTNDVERPEAPQKCGSVVRNLRRNSVRISRSVSIHCLAEQHATRYRTSLTCKILRPVVRGITKRNK